MYLSLNIKQSISIYKIEVVKMLICQSAQKYNLYYNFPSGNASSVVINLQCQLDSESPRDTFLGVF